MPKRRERGARPTRKDAKAERRKGIQNAATQALKQQAEEAHLAAAALHQEAKQTHRSISKFRAEAKARARRPPQTPPEPFHELPEKRPRGKKQRQVSMRLAASEEPRSVLPFTVVGVGSSAGGFEAFVSMLRYLPRDLGVAVIYIQHLDPHHESRLTDLLSKVSHVPMQQITNGLRVEPGHIYVLPSNASVTMADGRLRLGPRQPIGQPMPIDVFFRSLAREQQHRCMGVVLSGTGTDGTLGVEEIKGQGGVTFAQEQSSAKYFGMPGSAIAAGTVDFVLTPEQIAREIARLAKHTYIAADVRDAKRPLPVPNSPDAETLFRQGGEDLKTLFSLLRSRTGVDFSLYKPGTLNRRIMRRMVLQKIDTLPLYVRFVQEHPNEVDALFGDLLISVTGFFRDAPAFTAFQKRLLPRLLRNRRDDAPLRIWTCGCSTGEEAYSLAITVTEFLEKAGRHLPVQIFASDLNERAVEKARSGIYSENIALDVPPERLRRFFSKVDGNYQVTKSIRDLCVFARQNVVFDPPFSNLDIISCRNVLIYLTSVLQRRIIPIFHYALKPGGFLLLGSSETIGEHSELFELVDKTNKVYAKKATAYRATFDFENRALTRGVVPPPRPPPPAEKADLVNGNLQQKIDRLIVHQYSPPAVIVNTQMDVLHFRGKTGTYLEHPAGSASLNLLKMAREDLSLDLRRVVNKAIQTGDRSDAVAEFRHNGRTQQVRLDVHPVTMPPENERFFLILFVDVTPATGQIGVDPRSPEKSKRAQKQLEARRVTKLQQELASTKESLQAIIEEQEATNEELKSANEEIQSSNEELQSTNEELETAREELQSTNEELTTLNQELQNRNSELAQLNNDLTNLLASVNIAVIMLGTDLTIRRFTPTAEKIFSLIPSDIGRRLTDLSRSIQVPDLGETIQEVVDNLTTVQREVQDRDGHWYSLRIRPYRTRESRIDGVVLMLFDIDELKRAIGHIISLVRHPVLALQADLKVTRANEAFYRAFKLEPDQVEGKRVYNISKRQWNVPRLRQLLEEILPAQGEVRDFRVDHESEKAGKRSLILNARRFYEESRGVQLILLAIEDLGTR